MVTLASFANISISHIVCVLKQQCMATCQPVNVEPSFLFTWLSETYIRCLSWSCIVARERQCVTTGVLSSSEDCSESG